MIEKKIDKIIEDLQLCRKTILPLVNIIMIERRREHALEERLKAILEKETVSPLYQKLIARML